MKKQHEQPVILHPLNDELYQYHLGIRFDPGAMAETFDPLFVNPLFSVGGAGRSYRGTPNPVQPPQVYFNQQRGVNGLGGIQTGQLISQPLIDPSTFEGA